MKTCSISAMIPLAVLAAFVWPVRASTVTMNEALTVAENWITLTLKNEGSWGGADTGGVGVKEALELKRGERLVGYLFNIHPKGYIVVSPRKDLAPVAAYSETGALDPDSEEGMAGFVKLEMERILDEVEMPASQQITIQGMEATVMATSNHLATWELLEYNIEVFVAGLEAGVIAMNYQGGEPPLLTSSWEQADPYNSKCPDPGILSSCSKLHCMVGCTPLAGAQIMRYWAWPPAYDWANMPDKLGASSTTVQIDAVAKLCYDVGHHAEADYCIPGGKCQTFAFLTSDVPTVGSLLDAFEEDFRYDEEADEEFRGDDAGEWFAYFKEQLNKNRPVPYVVGKFTLTQWHTVVCDGWKQVGGDRYLHLNYGWGGGAPNESTPGYPEGEWTGYTDTNGWFLLGDLPYSGKGQHIIINLYPAPSLGTWLSKDPPHENDHVNYPVSSFPYRYFDQDTMGRNVTFAAGHKLQFLPGVKVRDSSPVAGHCIRFVGTPSANTRMFSIKGTSKGGFVAGIRLYDGGIRLYPAGSLRFH